MNGTSFRKTYGYLNCLLNVSSKSFREFVIPVRSEFLHRIRMTAFCLVRTCIRNISMGGVTWVLFNVSCVGFRNVSEE